MNRLHRAHRFALYAVFGALLTSGIAWEAMSPGAGAALIMKIHGAAGMLALVVIGMLLIEHVPAGWAAGTNRKSGVLMLAALAWLAATGYLLYYGSEALRSHAAWAHLWVGVAAAGIVGWHIRRSALTYERGRAQDEKQLTSRSSRSRNPARRSTSAAQPAPRARVLGRSSP